MIDFSLFGRDDFQPGRGGFAFQFMTPGDQLRGYGLHNDEHIGRGSAVGNVIVALRARVHGEAMRPDLAPELFVVHRPEPVFNIVDPTEFLHAAIVADRPRGLQIWQTGAGHREERAS